MHSRNNGSIYSNGNLTIICIMHALRNNKRTSVQGTTYIDLLEHSTNTRRQKHFSVVFGELQQRCMAGFSIFSA